MFLRAFPVIVVRRSFGVVGALIGPTKWSRLNVSPSLPICRLRIRVPVHRRESVTWRIGAGPRNFTFCRSPAHSPISTVPSDRPPSNPGRIVGSPLPANGPNVGSRFASKNVWQASGYRRVGGNRSESRRVAFSAVRGPVQPTIRTMRHVSGHVGDQGLRRQRRRHARRAGFFEAPFLNLLGCGAGGFSPLCAE